MWKYAPLEWTKDLFPEYQRYLTFVKKVFRHEIRKNGFRRISTPLLEDKKLYQEVLGQIEQWNHFVDTVLKTNPNISTLRAYLHAEDMELIQPVYYYYMDSYVIKGDDGNIKEHKLLGWEVIWEDDPILDAISIYITSVILDQIGLADEYKIRINTAGIEKEKVKFKEELVSFYENKKHLLSPSWLELLEKNPIALLWSHDEDEQILALQAPVMTKFLKKDSKNHYAKFKEYLDILEIPYKEDNTLVPDHDYNTNSIWDFKSLDWRIISKWARSNDLSKSMWYAKWLPTTGFYMESDIVVSLLKEKNIQIKNKDRIDLFFVQLWDEAKKVVLPLSLEARKSWINTVVSLWTPSMKEQMLKANRSDAKFVVMVGVMEARSWVFQVRNIAAGTQEEVQKEKLIEYIIDKIWEDQLDFYCPANDIIKE